MHQCYTPRTAARTRAGSEAGAAAASKRSRAAADAGGQQQQRDGGRAWNQFRPLFLDVDVVSQASGSAYLELEHTKVLCAVYGPKPRQDVEFTEQGKLLCDFRYAPFARRGGKEGRGPGAGPQDAEERALSQVIAEALSGSIRLEAMPKAVVEIYVLVLQAHGGELGAAISCASLALATAGVELYGLVAACSVLGAGGRAGSGSGKGQQAARLLLDPTAEEEGAARGTGGLEDNGEGAEGDKRKRSRSVGGQTATGLLHLSLMPASGEVTQLKQEGVFEGKEAMEAALELATDGAQMLHAMMRRRLLQTVVGVGGANGSGSKEG